MFDIEKEVLLAAMQAGRDAANTLGLSPADGGIAVVQAYESAVEALRMMRADGKPLLERTALARTAVRVLSDLLSRMDPANAQWVLELTEVTDAMRSAAKALDEVL